MHIKIHTQCKVYIEKVSIIWKLRHNYPSGLIRSIKRTTCVANWVIVTIVKKIKSTLLVSMFCLYCFFHSIYIESGELLPSLNEKLNLKRD